MAVVSLRDERDSGKGFRKMIARDANGWDKLGF